MIWPKRENVRSTGVPAKKEALAKGDIAPVLMRIKPENETEVRGAFKKALAVRGKGAEAQGLADTYFFEPPVAAADKALETGEVDELVKLVTEKVETVEAGMILAIGNCGIYRDSFGVRAEDTVWVSPDGPVALTRHPKALVV